jgi:hypothetical protein
MSESTFKEESNFHVHPVFLDLPVFNDNLLFLDPCPLTPDNVLEARSMPIFMASSNPFDDAALISTTFATLIPDPL